SVVVKQDPFHVMQRFSEKIKLKTIGKRLLKDLSSALYDVDRKLRTPEDMENNVRAILDKISTIRIVSTSPLESFHSALKKFLAREVRAELGLQILDVFIEMFQSATVNLSALESNLAQSRHHLKTIREMLFKKATVLQTSQVPTCEFIHSLRIDEGICEAATGFSFEEHELLRQIVGEQIACGRIWDNCPLVTTIMYNLVVASNHNLHIKLHRRSYRTLQNRKEFRKVYDFASCVCSSIRAFSLVSLLRRWEAPKSHRALNKHAKSSLKLLGLLNHKV
ncbi:hypothetical protein PHMEG_00016746, partial [Phytophthora megakarya]